MYDPADELIRFEEWSETINEREARDDAESCDMVDALMQ